MNILDSLTEHQQQQLQTYYDMLITTNQKFNLTAIVEREQVYVKHFADSMMGQVAIDNGATVVDIGCGAGFPSIPLKIYRNDIKCTLVDSLAKRIAFCQQVAQVIDIDIECWHSRAEDFAKAHREQYDVAVARAVAPLNILLEYTAPLVKVGGKIVAYKTDSSEIDNCGNAIKQLGVKWHQSIEFCLPNGDKRALLIFSKVSCTPTKYPRGGNLPRKSPL